MIIPHYTQSLLTSGTDLLSMYNYCGMEQVLPLADGDIEDEDKAILLGLFSQLLPSGAKYRGFIVNVNKMGLR